jgi:hypothetical protein
MINNLIAYFTFKIPSTQSTMLSYTGINLTKETYAENLSLKKIRRLR